MTEPTPATVLRLELDRQVVHVDEFREAAAAAHLGMHQVFLAHLDETVRGALVGVAEVADTGGDRPLVALGIGEPEAFKDGAAGAELHALDFDLANKRRASGARPHHRIGHVHQAGKQLCAHRLAVSTRVGLRDIDELGLCMGEGDAGRENAEQDSGFILHIGSLDHWWNARQAYPGPRVMTTLGNA